jgi:hypothetical protein
MGDLVLLISTLVRPLRIDAYIEYTVDAGIEPSHPYVESEPQLRLLR